MKLSPNATLADIASNHPSLLRELEQLGLDYCCGGHRSLNEACRQQGLDADAVVVALEHDGVSTEAPADWVALSPADLVDHLEATHHHYLKQELPRLDALAAKVSRAHGKNHPELNDVAAAVAEIRADQEPHLRKEEEMLFPMIRTLDIATSRPSVACGSIRNPITVLEAEHMVVGGLLARLRNLTNGYQAPADTCASTQALMVGLAQLEADTHLHVHKENNHLVPAVTAREEELCT